MRSMVGIVGRAPAVCDVFFCFWNYEVYENRNVIKQTPGRQNATKIDWMK